MSAHLRIGRLVITGLPLGQPALAFRDEIERALADLLSRDTIEHLRSRPPAPIPLITAGTPPPGRTLAVELALAIRDALLSPLETWQ